MNTYQKCIVHLLICIAQSIKDLAYHGATGLRGNDAEVYLEQAKKLRSGN